MSPIQSNTQEGLVIFPSNADLDGKVGYLAKLNSSGKVVLAGAGELAPYVIEDVEKAGANASITLRPLNPNRNVRLIAGEPIAAGAIVKSDASGKVTDVALTNGQFSVGVAEEAASTGGYVLVRPLITKEVIPA